MLRGQDANDSGAAAYPRHAAFIDGPQDDARSDDPAYDIIVTARKTSEWAINEGAGLLSRAWNGLTSFANSLFHGAARNDYQRDALVVRISRAVDRLPDRVAAYNPIAASLKGLGLSKSAAAVRGLAAAPTRTLIDTIESLPGFARRVGNGAYNLVNDPNQAMKNISTNVRNMSGIPKAIGDHFSGVGADLASGDPARIQNGSQSLGVDAINIGTLGVPIAKLTSLRGSVVVAAERGGILANGARGVASEARVLTDLGLTKNTQYVLTAEGRAIPDALTDTLSIEIKDTISVSRTAQIRIQTDAARAAGRESVLVTGINTRVSGPASRAFDQIIRRPDLGPQ